MEERLNTSPSIYSLLALLGSLFLFRDSEATFMNGKMNGGMAGRVRVFWTFTLWRQSVGVRGGKITQRD